MTDTLQYPAISDYAKSMIGTKKTIVTTKRGINFVVEGIIVGIERIPGVIRDGETGEEFAAIRFGIRTDDGKLKWSGSFPDRKPSPDDA